MGPHQTAERTTEKFARLIGADARSIGINASVSAAVGAILSAINFTAQRRRVVVSELDFPTVPDILLAYRGRGDIELEVLPEQNGDVPSELHDGAIDNRTALACISAGSYATGALLPVRRHFQHSQLLRGRSRTGPVAGDWRSGAG